MELIRFRGQVNAIGSDGRGGDLNPKPGRVLPFVAQRRVIIDSRMGRCGLYRPMEHLFHGASPR